MINNVRVAISIRKFFMILLLSFTFLTKCSTEKKKPNKIISKEKFTKILINIQLLDSRIKFEKNKGEKVLPDNIQKEYKNIFQKHNISSKKFRKSYQHYLKKEKAFKNIQEIIIQKLGKKKDKIQ